MTRGRYLRAVAEAALEAGRSVPDELEGALAATVDAPTPAEREALAEARAGRLAPALDRLGFDPLAAACAALRPEAAPEAARRLSALPGGLALWSGAAVALLYLSFVAVVELGAASLLGRWVEPALSAARTSSGGATPAVAAALDWALPLLPVLVLFTSGGALAVALAPPLRRGFRRAVAAPLAQARVATAAAALVERGVPPAEALERLGPLEGIDAGSWARHPGGGIDAAALGEVARTCAARAQERVDRLTIGVKTAGTLALVLAAGAILATVLGSLPELPAGFGP